MKKKKKENMKYRRIFLLWKLVPALFSEYKIKQSLAVAHGNDWKVYIYAHYIYSYDSAHSLKITKIIRTLLKWLVSCDL